MDALDAMEEWSTPFMAQDNWLDVMKINYLSDEHAIEGYWLQAYNAWYDDKYYESGNLGGLIDTYLFKMPSTI
jgi:hypothetical protein